ncbi:1-aminocyclopropane-1-carboxylate oxidase 1 [Bienertia sinuspersici]
MEKVKQFIDNYYEENLKENFLKSNITKALENKDLASNKDWESSFFIWHRPNSNMNDFEDFSKDFRETMDMYIDQLVKVAEKLSELMCENLSLEKDHMKTAFSGNKGPAVGTKVANILNVRTLNSSEAFESTLMQEGLYSYCKTIKSLVSSSSKMANGDQVEIISNGRYKSILHRVMTGKSGSRLSVATFYNPAPDAVISPAQKLVYPGNYQFQDYLKMYSSTKFLDKGHRFETMKNNVNAENGFHK